MTFNYRWLAEKQFLKGRTTVDTELHSRISSYIIYITSYEDGYHAKKFIFPLLRSNSSIKGQDIKSRSQRRPIFIQMADLSGLGPAAYPEGQQPFATFAKNIKNQAFVVEVHDITNERKKRLAAFDMRVSGKPVYIGFVSYDTESDHNGVTCGYIQVLKPYQGQHISSILGYSLALLAQSLPLPQGGTEMSIIAIKPDPNLALLWIKAGLQWKEAQEKEWAHYKELYGIDDRGFYQVKQMDNSSKTQQVVRTVEEKKEADAIFTQYVPFPDLSGLYLLF